MSYFLFTNLVVAVLLNKQEMNRKVKIYVKSFLHPEKKIKKVLTTFVNTKTPYTILF